jgi:hypothetical protein
MLLWNVSWMKSKSYVSLIICINDFLHLVDYKLISFSPSVTAARVAADEEQGHPFLPSGSGLEEHGLAVATDRAPDRLGARESRIAGDILEHLGELSGAVVHHIPVDAVVVCNLLVVTVPAGIEQNLLVPILLGIQYVVAFAAKFHGTHGC